MLNRQRRPLRTKWEKVIALMAAIIGVSIGAYLFQAYRAGVPASPDLKKEISRLKYHADAMAARANAAMSERHESVFLWKQAATRALSDIEAYERDLLRIQDLIGEERSPSFEVARRILSMRIEGTRPRRTQIALILEFDEDRDDPNVLARKLEALDSKILEANAAVESLKQQFPTAEGN